MEQTPRGFRHENVNWYIHIDSAKDSHSERRVWASPYGQEQTGDDVSDQENLIQKEQSWGDVQNVTEKYVQSPISCCESMKASESASCPVIFSGPI